MTIVKRIANGILWLAAMLSVLVLLAYGALHSGWGKDKLTALLAESLDAEITGLSGNLPFAPTVDSLTLKDANGAWLTATHIRIAWDFDLSPFTLHIHRLEADNVTLLRLPESGDDSTSSPTALPRIDLQSIRLPHIAIEKAITGHRQILAANGSIRSYAAKGQPEARFTLHTVEGATTRLEIILQGMETISLDAKLEEAPGGLFGALLALPTGDGLNGHLQLHGSLAAWQSDIKLTTSSTELLIASLSGIDADNRLTITGQTHLQWPETLAYADLRDTLGETLAADLHLAWDGSSLHLDNTRLAAPQLETTISGNISGTAEALALDLSGILQRMELLPNTAKKLTGSAAPFTLKATLEQMETLHIASLTLTGEHAALTGKEATIGSETLAGTFRLIVPEAHHLHESLRGELKVNITLKGSPAAPKATIQAELQDGKRKLQLATILATEGDLLKLSGMKLSTHGLSATGTLAYDMKTELAKGTLDIHADDLSGLNAFLASQLAGSGDAKVTLFVTSKQQSAKISGELKDAAYEDTQAATLQFNLAAADIAALENIHADITAANITRGDTHIDRLHLIAEGNKHETRFALNAASAAAPALTLHTSGSLAGDAEAWTLALAELRGAWETNPFALAKPATIHGKPDYLSSDNLAVTLGDGRIEATGTIAKANSDMQLTFTQLPLAMLTTGEADGDLSGTIHLTGESAGPTVTFTAKADIPAHAEEKKQSLQLAATGQLKDGLLTLHGETENAPGECYADVTLPMQFSAIPFNLTIPPQGRLGGTLVVDTKIAPLMALLLPPDQTMSGAGKGAFTLAGTLTAPTISGNFTLANGRYENQTTGTLLKEITVQLRAADNRITISNGSAKAGKGNVTISGNIALSAPYPLTVNMAMQDATVIQSREANGVINGTLALEGDIAAPLISGELVLGPMNITLPEQLGADVAEITIDNPDVLPTQVWQRDKQPVSFGSDQVRLKLTIDAPAQVFVRGRGVDTEMRGKIAINGTLAKPEVEGKLTTVRGRYTLLDRELDITEGTLTFRGAMPPSPYINMLAETETDELKAGVRVEGSVRSPSIKLTSTPSRPEDEIMAQLLFGRDLKSITPFQAAQLAQAIQSLRGGGSNMPDFLGKARDLLGVDRLDVGEMDSGDIGVGAGKYINDNIYVGVEGGASPEAGKVKAEIEVSPRFSIETETGGRTSGARFNWKRDY